MSVRAATIVLCGLVLVGCPGSGGGDPYAHDDPKPKPFKNWYPDDIAPPDGTEYPCPLDEHPLPEDLKGIPNKDRRFVNHVYSQILACVQAKLVMYEALGAPGDEAALATYRKATDAALKKIEDEPTPEGLGPFRDDVVKAIHLQQTFFEKARAQLKGHRSQAAWKKAHTISEGHEASDVLKLAWGKMQARYGKHWSPEMNKAIYHHLCALDLF